MELVAPNRIYLCEGDPLEEYSQDVDFACEGDEIFEYTLTRSGKMGPDGKPAWFGKRGI